MYVVSPSQIPEIDHYAASVLGIPTEELIARAGNALAKVILDNVPQKSHILFLCGTGNNGKDGEACAEILQKEGYGVTVIPVFAKRDHLPEIKERLKDTACVVDAILGTGAKFGLPPHLIEIFSLCNHSSALRISADMPTGIDGEYGTAHPGTFMADITVTFAAPKIGMLSYPAKQYVGQLIVDDLGLPVDMIENVFPSHCFCLDDRRAKQLLPPTSPQDHKGKRGNVALLCGSEQYPGAALLAAEAALRSGVGLTTVYAPQGVCDKVQIKLPDAICKSLTLLQECDLSARLSSYSALVIGPGWGKRTGLATLLQNILSTPLHLPIVVDADAINLLADDQESSIQLCKNVNNSLIFTPHPLEFSRLFGGEVAYIQDHRIPVATQAAKRVGATVLLKGGASVIACSDDTVWINPTGGPALSKGGAGDVLSGLLGGLLAQGLRVPCATALSAYLHGKAADTLTLQYSPLGVRSADLPLAIAKEMAHLYFEI
ncbi:MAG: NAD(P)H-hydrate dehydratase [Clostridia bacterium]|nr:NAD(P)H-hydrate dehydratase [Clostridia bacterium]